MFWADRVAKKIKARKLALEWVDDMKTPSGKIHSGSLRGVIFHDLIYKALLDAGVKAVSTYVIDDHDPMDSLPVYLNQKKYQRYLGWPLNKIPAPEPGYQSYAQYFAQDFIEVFNRCGCQPKIIWASELYRSGKMNQGIKLCLDNAPRIRQIYKKVSGSAKPSDWYPLQVICEQCGKVGTTQVVGWDGEKVSYRCRPDLVTWAKGCGHEGKITPLNGAGKLPWKIEWAVKWQAVGVTVEGAGKDHMTVGGSHDIAAAVCQEILHYPVPYPFAYEFFLIAGRKMSSSKGLGSSVREMINLLPAAILRFLITRTVYKRAINFDPGGETIPDLFDEYDRCAQEWFEKGRQSDLGRIFELSQVNGLAQKPLFLTRFRDVANYLQMPSVDLEKHFSSEKGSRLTAAEKAVLKERMKYARIWLDSYAPENLVFRIKAKIPQAASRLSKEQKEYLKSVADLLKKDLQPKELEYELYELAKKQKISSKEAFQALYLTLIGKTHGPKAAWLLLSQKKGFLIKRLKEAAND